MPLRSVACALAVLLVAASPAGARPAYPPSPVRPVTDAYHGETVVDGYRWLENGQSAEVKSWTDAQNTFTRKRLDALPHREALRSRLLGLMSPARQQPPIHRGGRYFFLGQSGSQRQAVLMVQEGLKGKPHAVVDPNPLSADGTISLDWWEASPGGRFVAYGLSEGGSEQSVLHLLDVTTGQARSETITGCRYASIAWMPDERGFFYTRFPGQAGTANQQVYFHALGRDVTTDAVVFAHAGGPEMIHWVQSSANGRWVIVGVNKGSSSTNELYVRDMTVPDAPFKPIVTGFQAQYSGDVWGDTLYMRTTEGAPRGQVLTVDLQHPERAGWRPLLAQAPEALQGLFVAGDKLVADYLHNATSVVRIHSLQGKFLSTIQLPGLGTVSGLVGFAGDRNLFFSFTSYVQPKAIFRYDVAAATLTPFFTPTLPVKTDGFVQRQVWFTSKDGTRVPMFLIHKKGLAMKGRNRTLLTGYGGFDISITPQFSAVDYVWIERGGVLAVPSLRGGGEFGEAWHRAGTRERKQNVFDDFYAAAGWLIQNKVTTPAHLGIEGGSNGGLLMGAAVTQRPELWRAVVCGVPLLDMLRYHNFLIARYWVPEYGASEDADAYTWLKAYSPYHHVVDGRKYPATLIRTAESDTRVDPLHARKMAARMQAAQGGDAPVMLLVERKAGHGAGKPLTQRVNDAVDALSFLESTLSTETAR